MKQIILIEDQDAEDVDVKVNFLAGCRTCSGNDTSVNYFTTAYSRNVWADLHIATHGHQVHRTTEITIKT